MNRIKWILLAGVTAAAWMFQFYDFSGGQGTLTQSLVAEVAKEDWNPWIAETVNGQTISVEIGQQEYTSKNTPMFMDDGLNLMVSSDILTEGLQCASHFYGEELVIEKREDEIRLKTGDVQASINGKTKELASPMIRRNNRYFVSLKDLSQNLGFDFSWDMDKNRATLQDISNQTFFFPTHYDLREKGRNGIVKNQMDTGTCWAFASLSALESSLLPEENLEFSPDHMSMGNSFQVDTQEGGEYTMAVAYLLAWQGPVYEKDDPFGDGRMEEGLSAVKHVQEVRIIDGRDFEAIKGAVFQYGGVQTAMYSALHDSRSISEYYNREQSAYCYTGTEKSNHEVVIIGWDDNYPKENFPGNVKGNGAFICQNSWGDEFGEDGVFYVSYYDSNIGSHSIAYTKVEDTDNYSRIYQTDLCGWNGQIGFDREAAYGANVYTANGPEELSAVGFYATGKDTKYRLYLVRDFEDSNSLADGELIAEGSLELAGYYTIPTETGRYLEAGERFAVVLYIDTPHAIHPVAIEYAADESTKNVDLTDGEGYISENGRRWDHVEEAFACNLCIKAYTRER